MPKLVVLLEVYYYDGVFTYHFCFCTLGRLGNQYSGDLADHRRYHIRDRPWIL